MQNSSNQTGFKPVEFAKMSGGGNDFIVIDNRKGVVEDGGSLALRLCARGVSVGADGLILLEDSSSADVRMIYFNADGSRGEFCGNGTRCLARFALLQNVSGTRMTIETDSGIVPAALDGRAVTLEVFPPADVVLDRPLVLAGKRIAGSFLKVGVPHYVILESRDDFWEQAVVPLGRAIRNHRDLAPDGANVNFVRVRSRSEIEVRTYERGVEAETLACGSGVVASVAVSALSGLIDSPVSVLTRSGIRFSVSFSPGEGKHAIAGVLLSGDARLVYRGKLTEESWSGFDPLWVRNPTSEPPRP